MNIDTPYLTQNFSNSFVHQTLISCFIKTTDWRTMSQSTRGLRGKSISFSKPFESFLLFSGYVMFDSDPMDCSTPGLPDPHYLLEFAQVHVH